MDVTLSKPWPTPAELAAVLGCLPQRISELAKQHGWPTVEGKDGVRFAIRPEIAFTALHGPVTPAFGILQTR